MILSDVTTRAGGILFDPGHVRWAIADLIQYINDAQLQVVVTRPEANSKTASVPLVAGSRQAIPADGLRLLDVVRNMGSGGTTPGRSIIPAQRRILDAWGAGWHTETGQEIEHFVYDADADRRSFFVYPSAPAGHQIEIVYSAAPAKVPAGAALSTELELGDQYINPVLDWVLYRCYSREDEPAGSMTRAMAYQQAFYQHLGLDAAAAQTTDPTRPQQTEAR